jgi:hypothetical protein
MQYIQLQGQVAADLDLPLEGSYNLFIDTSDNSIKAKDSEGNLSGGGGISLVEISREAIGELVNDSGLTPGAFYKITGAASRSFYDNNEWSYSGMANEIQDGGSTIILQATTTKTLSTKGIGLFYVPNYEDPDNPTAPPDYNYLVWDSTSRLYFTSSFGKFDHDEQVHLYANGSSSLSNVRANIGGNCITLESPDDADFFTNQANYPMSIVGYDSNAWVGVDDYQVTASYVAGDKVIWGGRVWTNRSGSVGNSTGGWPMGQLQLNEADWTKVAFNETDYTLVADLIEYEFEWDNISYRKSKNNVEVTCTHKAWGDYWGYNTMKYFPWGHYQTQNISISNSYLDAFVNYPHDAWASEISFKDYGGFNAHYWGRSTEIYGISSDFGGHMVSLNLGYNTEINTITLGVGARLSDIYTYDNDNGTTALQNIVIGDSAAIDDDSDPIYMYYNSFMEDLILDTNSGITDINLYDGANIRNVKLSNDAYIVGIGLDDYAAFRQVELGISSYIEYMNMGVSACFKRVKLGIDSYINALGIGYNGYFKHIEMGDASHTNCIVVGNNSYFQYVNLGISSTINGINQTAGNSNFEYINVGIDSSIYNIELGIDCSFNHIKLGSDSNINNISIGGGNAYIRHIDIKNTSYFNYITMQDGSYIRRMDIGSDSEISYITLTGGTSISDFKLATTTGTGGFDILASSSLSNFELGQNAGFGGNDITASLSNITLSRGFNNLNNNKTFTGVSGSSLNADYSGNPSNLPYLDIDNRGVVLLDITGFPEETVNYRLNSGEYEGQEIKFVVRNSSGTVYPASTDVRVWCDDLQYPIQYTPTGYVQNSSFAPFAHYDPTFNSGEWVWRPMGKAIWTNGMWVTDAEYYYYYD